MQLYFLLSFFKLILKKINIPGHPGAEGGHSPRQIPDSGRGGRLRLPPEVSQGRDRGPEQLPHDPG